MFWILHGEDEFRRSEFLAKLKKGLGDPAEVEINTTLLDGRRVKLSEIVHSCGAIPFLGTSRLVVVDGLLAHLGRARKPSKTNKKADSTPELGRCVLVELNCSEFVHAGFRLPAAIICQSNRRRL